MDVLAQRQHAPAGFNPVAQHSPACHMPHHCAVQDALRLAAQGCDALPAEALVKLRAAARGGRPIASSQVGAVDAHAGKA